MEALSRPTLFLFVLIGGAASLAFGGDFFFNADVSPVPFAAIGSSTNSLGEIITFESSTNENYFKFNRAQTYGRSDDIIISYGTCEKF